MEQPPKREMLLQEACVREEWWMLCCTGRLCKSDFLLLRRRLPGGITVPAFGGGTLSLVNFEEWLLFP